MVPWCLLLPGLNSASQDTIMPEYKLLCLQTPEFLSEDLQKKKYLTRSLVKIKVKLTKDYLRSRW